MAELALADRMRVSHSHLRGGPALWTPEDLEKALAFRAYDSGRCDCGAHREDWKDGQHPYEAYAYRCPGCEDIGVLQSATTRDAPPEATHGIRFGLRLLENAPS